MPQYPPPGLCPLCLTGQYHQVMVRRPNRDGHYQTQFYACCGCTVMFLDVKDFMRSWSLKSHLEAHMEDTSAANADQIKTPD
jgi:hypothetical protein